MKQIKQNAKMILKFSEGFGDEIVKQTTAPTRIEESGRRRRKTLVCSREEIDQI